MEVEAVEAGEGEEGGAGHRGQQVVVQRQPLQPGQPWVQGVVRKCGILNQQRNTKWVTNILYTYLGRKR